jgi:hypothetical protein
MANKTKCETPTASEAVISEKMSDTRTEVSAMAPFDIETAMDEITPLITGRLFNICRYYMSMRTLLVRSAKVTPHNQNLDIAFWGVSYISLCTSIGTLTIRSPSVGETYTIETALGRPLKQRREKLFVVKGDASVGYVVGTSFSLSVSDGNPGETPSLPLFLPYKR